MVEMIVVPPYQDVQSIRSPGRNDGFEAEHATVILPTGFDGIQLAIVTFSLSSLQLRGFGQSDLRVLQRSNGEQRESDGEKILWIPNLSRYGTRSLSLAWYLI